MCWADCWREDEDWGKLKIKKLKNCFAKIPEEEAFLNDAKRGM